MPALCSHGQAEGGSGGGMVNQMWTGLDGVPNIPKFVRTSFMDDPTAEWSILKLDNIILFFFNVFYEEAATGGVQYSCQNVLFSIKLQAWGLQFYKKRNSGTGAFQVILESI